MNKKESWLNFSKEYYGLNWFGKSYAKLRAKGDIRTFLREDEIFNSKEENRDSENILIKGDNLEVLKHLSNIYFNKIKMIYIDPPYNTGNDIFIYNDRKKFTLNELKDLAGLDELRAKRVLNFIDSRSNSHSAWLTFIYPRLYISRELLRDDGVIFISIDDNEVAQLKLLMDEIFGEDNFVGQIIWLKRNAQNDASNIEKNHEYLLVYQKTNSAKISRRVEDIKEVFKDESGEFYYIGAGITTGGEGGVLNARPNLGYSIYYNSKSGDFFGVSDYDKSLARVSNREDEIYKTNENLLKRGYIPIRPPKKRSKLGCWTWSLDKFNLEKHKILIKRGKSGFSIYKKEFVRREDIFSKNGKFYVKIVKEKPFKSFIDDISSSLGTKELNQLLNIKVFQNPKPTKLIKQLIEISNTSKTDIILDFFAGSGTTGEALMQLNSEDGGRRKYILVQIDEPIDPKRNRTAYEFVKNELGVENPTIFEITKERLIRASQKIGKSSSLNGLDLGFKIFELKDI